MKAKIWTDNEIKFLRENLDKYTWAQIAEKLGRSKKAVEAKAKQLGLKKKQVPPPEVPERITCVLCKRRKEVGVSGSGQRLYYCPYYKITIGEEALPSPECLPQLKEGK